MHTASQCPAAIVYDSRPEVAHPADQTMLPDSLTVVAGLVVLIWGADRFVHGAAATARNLGVEPLMIGLTVVAFATSAPEILVSIRCLAPWPAWTGLWQRHRFQYCQYRSGPRRRGHRSAYPASFCDLTPRNAGPAGGLFADRFAVSRLLRKPHRRHRHADGARHCHDLARAAGNAFGTVRSDQEGLRGRDSAKRVHEDGHYLAY